MDTRSSLTEHCIYKFNFAPKTEPKSVVNIYLLNGLYLPFKHLKFLFFFLPNFPPYTSWLSIPPFPPYLSGPTVLFRGILSSRNMETNILTTPLKLVYKVEMTEVLFFLFPTHLILERLEMQSMTGQHFSTFTSSKSFVIHLVFLVISPPYCTFYFATKLYPYSNHHPYSLTRKSEVGLGLNSYFSQTFLQLNCLDSGGLLHPEFMLKQYFPEFIFM